MKFETLLAQQSFPKTVWRAVDAVVFRRMRWKNCQILRFDSAWFACTRVYMVGRCDEVDVICCARIAVRISIAGESSNNEKVIPN